MKNKNLTNHYCESYIAAANIGAIKHCKFLSSQPEFSDTYISKKHGHIIQYIALSGNHTLLEESFKNSSDLREIRFLDIVNNSARSSDLKSVKIVLDNRDRFKDNDQRNYQYNINFALRYAGELGHLAVFNHLLSVGAESNQWHVLRWVSDKGPKNTYERLLQANKLPLSTKRKFLIQLCENQSKLNNWDCVDLSGLV